jgi:hypothetical protein
MSEVLAGDEASLRAFVARVVGWANTGAIEHALRSIHLGVTHRAALVLLGDTDLVPIAHSIHRRTIGADRPFVVCDGRQPISGLAAAQAAYGGSLCLRRRRLPRDFPSLMTLLREPHASTQIIVCAEARHASQPFLVKPVPIRVPPLTARASELRRIADEYALDAISTLGAGGGDFTETDRAWVLDHAATTLADIETATLRLVALRTSATTAGAAKRLGMSHVALAQWMRRRRISKGRTQ